MSDVRLRPMTDAEFAAFRAEAIREYAAEHVRAGDWRAEEAEALSAEQTDRLLPAGARTDGMLIVVAETEPGDAVGTAWVALDQDGAGGAWIYSIEVAREARGRGLGRALLTALEREVGARGGTSMGLNVFGSNSTARALYESSGYEVTSLHMRKSLS
jgi:ribosomal protein S18 acetylase RimI-like enzyme